MRQRDNLVIFHSGFEGKIQYLYGVKIGFFEGIPLAYGFREVWKGDGVSTFGGRIKDGRIFDFHFSFTPVCFSMVSKVLAFYVMSSVNRNGDLAAFPSHYLAPSLSCEKLTSDH